MANKIFLKRVAHFLESNFLRNIFKLRQILTLQPFDVTSERGREVERYRRAAVSIGAHIFSRVVAMVVMVLTVSLTIPYLGSERFGIWMTIASLSAMLSFLDLGVGNALTNKIAHAAVDLDPNALKSLISGGLGFLLLLGCATGMALTGLTMVAPWESIIKIQNKSVYLEIQQTASLFAILFSFQILSNGILRVFAGLQLAYQSHLINTLGSMISILSLILATNEKSGIPILLASTLGVQIATNYLLLIILVKRRLIDFSGLINHIRKETPKLIKSGAVYFVLQIGFILTTGADNLIISSTMGAAQVATYSVAQRLFQFVTQPMSIMNAPLWGAYADADARGDKSFIKKTLAFSLLISFIFSIIISAILFFLGPALIGYWSSNKIIISHLLLGVIAFWTVLEVSGNSFGVFLNGCGIVRPQLAMVALFSLVSLPLKFYAASIYGIESMIIVVCLIYIASIALIYGLYFRKKWNQKIK